jgi:preprotein translocase subunit SecA
MEEGVPIEHGMVTRAIERAQKQVEAQNFSVRKHLLEYDDVMNKQRESVYTLRREILDGRIHLAEEELGDTRDYLLATAEETVQDLVDRYVGKAVELEDWDLDGLRREVVRVFGLPQAVVDEAAGDDRNTEEILDALWAAIKADYAEKEAVAGAEIFRRVERDIMLQIVDTQWKDHLYSLDHLKEGIGLRGYGQRDPLVEYKKESFALFQDMKVRIEEEIVRYLFHLRPVMSDDEVPEPPRPVVERRAPAMTMHRPAAESVIPAFAGGPKAGAEPPQPARTGGDDVVRTIKHDGPKVGRNDPCPCGSGKKYKKCHGAGA